MSPHYTGGRFSVNLLCSTEKSSKMHNTLFLQSNVQNPYEIYERMLEAQPLYWDEVNQLWAVYAYDECRYLLNNEVAEIPRQSKAFSEMMNEYTKILLDKLVRLSNPPLHQMMRPLASQLFEGMKAVEVGAIVDSLIGAQMGSMTFDWVATVCKKLPVLSLLKGFGFSEIDSELILSKIEPLVKIMAPNKTTQQVEDINGATQLVYPTVERFLTGTSSLSPLIKNGANTAFGREELLARLTANLIGLFIQSFDAGRGLLSNTLLQYLKFGRQRPGPDKDYFRKSVIETVRFDPPIHNTRRNLVKEVVINGTEIKAGAMVLLVLAAANRDGRKFSQPNQYDIHRPNNEAHLTFGSGPHECLANHYGVDLAAQVLMYLFGKYSSIRLLEEPIQYEPLINARLPQKMLVSLSK
jgi:cytochrome P450